MNLQLFPAGIILLAILLTAWSAAAAPTVRVLGVRFSSQANSCRVVVDLESNVPYRSGSLSDPERFYLDLLGTQLAPELSHRIPVGDPVLRQIRIAENRDSVTRLVLDLNQAARQTVTVLSDPPRLVVDLQPLASIDGTTKEATNASASSGTARESRTSSRGHEPFPTAKRNPPTYSGESLPRNIAPIDQSSSLSQRRIPRQPPQRIGAFEGVIHDANGSAIGGANVILRNLSTGEKRQVTSNVEGIFRLLGVKPGRYGLKIEGEGYEPFAEVELPLAPGEVAIRELTLNAISGIPTRPPGLPQVTRLPTPAAPPGGPPAVRYPVLQQRLELTPGESAPAPEGLPPADQVFQPEPDRWVVTMPDWNRYSSGGEHPYVKGRWWDPFDRNKLKGDVPFFGQRTFFNLTGVSHTFFDGRRLPVPSNVSAARPGSSEFFGKGEQGFLDQVFLFSFDLFHGDTSFRPVDWRIRVTPAVSLNYLDVRELGIVDIDVRKGTTRLDAHAGLQEAFVEVKLHDLSQNYDFVSVRAGIQAFNSDFRGFLFVDEQPGVRFFGNLHSNRWQYNLAYFNFLEKDTNSGLNSFELRHQQVVIANLYRQDFFWPGYTTQFSVHYNKDDASIHFDKNGFLVRPAPIGRVVSAGGIRSHNIRVAYLGWTGDGHIGRLNLSHAFYQALGTDDFNAIAGRSITVNAQMAALELSVDKDWARLKGSIFYASGSARPGDGHARGFDAIEDFPEFAGGIFSLWNREGIRLTGSGVTLTPPNSLLPSLRSSKDEGQANFVNPGILLVNAGMNFEVTPKLRSFVNVNYLRFMRTEPLELILFQAPIRHTIGVDSSLGVRYRPPLTENIILTAGASCLIPGRGFKDIYTGKTLFSVFADLQFQF